MSELWLVNIQHGIDFRTVDELCLDENGKPIREEQKIDPDEGDEEDNLAWFDKRRIQVQYQTRTTLQAMRVSLSMENVSLAVGETRTSFALRYGPNKSYTLASPGKPYMLTGRSIVAEDHRLGVIVIREEWTYYDRWKKAPKSWNLQGEVLGDDTG